MSAPCDRDLFRRAIAAEIATTMTGARALVAKDKYGASGRDTAAGLISVIEDWLQGVELAGTTDLHLLRRPRRAVWVKRIGVMVDRISSAWLIRRFIDPAARFKFVPRRGYRLLRGALRFDMSGAGYTHEDDRSTFEVLLDRFGLDDLALRPIAEIVHQLDLEDSKYGRSEASGVGGMIVGLAIANVSDDVRLAQGGAVLENLYEAFRERRARPSTNRSK